MRRRLSLFLLAVIQLTSISARSVRQIPTCSFESDDYSLSWEYDELSSDVVFKLSASSHNPSFWSGVYFGDDEKPTDVIGIFVRSGQIGLVDGHVNAENDIESDVNTNVQSLAFDLQDHILTAEFARPLTSNDKTDADLSNCVTFYFPTVAPAIDLGAPIEIPKDLVKRRVCDLAVSCTSGKPAAVVKRADNAPATCNYENRDKSKTVSWKSVGDNLVFNIEQPVKKGKWWTAIGAGESMQDMDLVVAFTENGKVLHTGGYKSIGYSIPENDETISSAQKLQAFDVADDKTRLSLAISKSFLTSRMQNNCVTVQIAILGGTYAKKKNDFIIQKHKDSPVAVTVCDIDQCNSDDNTSESVSSSLMASASSTAASPPPINDIEDAVVEKNVHLTQETEPEQELLSVENPKREDEKVVVEEGSGQQGGIFESASRELQELQGSGEEPAAATSSNTSQPSEALSNPTEQPLNNNTDSNIIANNVSEQSLASTPSNIPKEVLAVDTGNNASNALSNPTEADQLLSTTPPANIDVVSTTVKPAENNDAVLTEAPSVLLQNRAEVMNTVAPEGENAAPIESSGMEVERTDEPKQAQSIFDLSVSNLTSEIANNASQSNETLNASSTVNLIDNANPSTSASPSPTVASSAPVMPVDSSSPSPTVASSAPVMPVDSSSALPTVASSAPVIPVDSSSPSSFEPMLTSSTANSINVSSQGNEQEGSGEEPLVTGSEQPAEVKTTVNADNSVTTTTTAIEKTENASGIVSSTSAIPSQTCAQDDLKICQSYFDDYLIKVADWAHRHNFSSVSQQWKACKLLADVKNVQTLCCNRYQRECANVTPPPVPV